MMVKDTESGVEFPLGQRFWWVLQLMHAHWQDKGNFTLYLAL